MHLHKPSANNPAVLQSFYRQSYGTESNMLPSLNAFYHQPFGDNSVTHRGTEYPSPEKVSINYQDEKPLAHWLNGSECNLNQNPISDSCIYSAIGSKEIEFSDDLPQQVPLPSNYYMGTYPLTVQVPEALPKINMNIYSESHKALENENYAISDAFSANKLDETKAFGGAFTANKPFENKISDNYELHSSFPRSVEGNIDSNKGFDFKIHQTAENKSILFQNCLPHPSVSDTVQETHYHNGVDLDLSPNNRCPYPTVLSGSKKCFNWCPESPLPESNETNNSKPVNFQVSDVSTYGNLQSSMLQQLVKPSLDFKESYSPPKKVICTNPCNFSRGKSDPLTLQNHKSGARKNTGYFVQNPHQLLQNDPIKQPVQDSHAQKSKTTKIQLQKLDSGMDGAQKQNSIEFKDFQAHKNKTTKTKLQKQDSGINGAQKQIEFKDFQAHKSEITKSKLQKHDSGMDGAQKQDHIEFNTRKSFEDDPLAIHITDMFIESTAKNVGLNSVSSKSSNELIMKEALHGSTPDVSNFKLGKLLSPEYTKNVNIFIFGLYGCDTIRLVKTLARYSPNEIPQKFGLAFQGSIGTPAMTLKIKCWRLKNYGSFANLRISDQPSKNVVILVYDVTQKLDLFDLRPEIESLKLTKFPIVLVENTSNVCDPSWDSLDPEDATARRQGHFMKHFYELSLYFRCSIECNKDTNGLFAASINLALRQKM